MDRQKINELIEKIETMEAELYRELSRDAEEIRCDFMNERIPLWTYIRKGNPKYGLSAPIIYAMIVPALVMDVSVTIYQATCFPLYGIPKVKRGEFIVFDRHRLPYLNALQKLNCLYCAYFNGLIAYVREIASKTEQFWCPIRHARRIRGVHHRYWHFMRYGDGEKLKERWMKLREALKEEENK